MLKNICNGTAAFTWGSHPIFFAQIMQVGKQRVGRVALKRFLDKPGQSIDGNMRIPYSVCLSYPVHTRSSQKYIDLGTRYGICRADRNPGAIVENLVISHTKIAGVWVTS